MNKLAWVQNQTKRFFENPIERITVYSNNLIENLKRIPINYPLNGYSYNPRNVALFPTYRCNEHCKMCLFHGPAGVFNRLPKEELSLDEWKRIIDDLATFKPSIEITGGEPFLSQDLMELVRYIKSKGCYCVIFTNCSKLTRKNAKEIVNSGLDRLCVSIDGPKEIHDKIRGVLGTFDTAVKGIKLVKKFRGRKKKPIIDMRCTITPHNITHLKEVVLLAKELDVDMFVLKHLWFSTEKMIKEHNKFLKKHFKEGMVNVEGMNIKSPNPELVVKKILELKKLDYNKLRLLPDFSLSEIKTFYLNPSYPIKERCIFPWIYASIKPNGDLSICYHSYIVGNLRGHRFKSLWNNEKARLFRRLLQQKKSFPACPRCGGMVCG